MYRFRHSQRGVVIPRSPRVAVAVWLLFAFLVWNDVFDVHVRSGMYEYLGRQARYEQGLGPRASIDGMMRPAIRAGLRAATAWAALIASIGLGAVAWARHRERTGARRSRHDEDAHQIAK